MVQDRFLHGRKRKTKLCIQALRGVSLMLKRGEWLGIHGPNGSGKTTLLRILAGLMPPDEGAVTREGTMSCFLGLGGGFHPERCAEENVYMHGLLHGLASSEIRSMMPQVMEFSGIGASASLPYKCYSTGMKLRLAFAAAAFLDSEIYILDEVMEVGDREFQERCTEHLRMLRRQGKSVILVVHNVDALNHWCDRVVEVKEGKMAPPWNAAAQLP